MDVYRSQIKELHEKLLVHYRRVFVELGVALFLTSYLSAVFSLFECYIEKYRAVHDATNGVTAGCVTGAVLAIKQGPGVSLTVCKGNVNLPTHVHSPSYLQAMAVGCGGFAAFSAAMDRLMSPSE